MNSPRLPMRVRRAAVFVSACGLFWLSGCGRSAPPPPHRVTTPQDHVQVYQRTSERFRQGAFLSPAPESTSGELRFMSPLIVQQFDEPAIGCPAQTRPAPFVGFGRLSIGPSGEAVVDSGVPTIYHAASEVELQQRSWSQSTYLWFHPPEMPGGRIRWRGFRMLLGERGYALAWEILSSESELRVFYVSQPLEKAARDEHGEPLPGRRYSIEPPLKHHPDVIVARAVGDGPQPMGPFILLDRSLEVTALICRCEPSQVDEFPMSLHYQLADWSELPLVSQATNLASSALPDPASNSMARLRLPSGQGEKPARN